MKEIDVTKIHNPKNGYKIGLILSNKVSLSFDPQEIALTKKSSLQVGKSQLKLLGKVPVNLPIQSEPNES